LTPSQQQLSTITDFTTKKIYLEGQSRCIATTRLDLVEIALAHASFHGLTGELHDSLRHVPFSASSAKGNARMNTYSYIFSDKKFFLLLFLLLINNHPVEAAI